MGWFLYDRDLPHDELQDSINVPILVLMMLQSCQISLGRNMIFCQIEKHIILYRKTQFWRLVVLQVHFFVVSLINLGTIFVNIFSWYCSKQRPIYECYWHQHLMETQYVNYFSFSVVCFVTNSFSIQIQNVWSAKHLGAKSNQRTGFCMLGTYGEPKGPMDRTWGVFRTHSNICNITFFCLSVVYCFYVKDLSQMQGIF